MTNSSTADINECAVNTDGCNQVCTNTVGSFRCSCNTGYTLNANGRTCSGGIKAWYTALHMTNIELQISMSVLSAMVAATKFVQTHWDLFDVAAVQDTG